MLKRILAIFSALLTICFGAAGVHWVDRSRKEGWRLPSLGVGLVWFSAAICQFLSACTLWTTANEEAGDEDDFDDFEIITD